MVDSAAVMVGSAGRVQPVVRVVESILQLGAERLLLLGAREGERRPGPPLLTEHEPQLARRLELLGMVRAERDARLVLGQGAQPVVLEEAVLAAHVRTTHPRAALVSVDTNGRET